MRKRSQDSYTFNNDGKEEKRPSWSHGRRANKSLYGNTQHIIGLYKEKQQYTAKRKAFSSNARIAHMTSKVAFYCPIYYLLKQKSQQVDEGGGQRREKKLTNTIESCRLLIPSFAPLYDDSNKKSSVCNTLFAQKASFPEHLIFLIVISSRIFL